MAADENATRFQRIQFAETLRDASDFPKRHGSLRLATERLRRSVKLAEQLLTEDPARTDARRLLATNLLELSEVDFLCGLFLEAGDSCRQVAGVFRALLAAPKEGNRLFDRLLLAAALTRQGACHRELGHQTEALASHAEAVTELRAIQEDLNGKHFLGRALVEQSRTLARFPAGRAEAERGLDEAIKLWEDLRGRSRQVLATRSGKPLPCRCAARCGSR